MKLCRYGPGGHEKPGIIDSNGKLLDLSLIIDEIGPGRLEPRKLRALAAAVKVGRVVARVCSSGQRCDSAWLRGRRKRACSSVM